MQTLLTALIAIFCAGMVTAENPPVRLTVDLTDGSRIIGTSPQAKLTVISRIIGETPVPIDRILRIDADKDAASVMITLLNGDKVKGTPAGEALALDTLVGRVSIPWEKITGLICESADAAAKLDQGLIAYYPFVADAQDHSGNRHHGRIVGAGQTPEGIRFGGGSDTYVVVPRDEALEPVDELTLSMWVMGVPGQEAGHGWGTVLRKMSHCDAGFGTRGGGVSSFNMCGRNPCAGGPVAGAAFLPFDAARWQHITATCSIAGGRIITYQNGEKTNEAAVNIPMVHSGDLYIGGSDVNGDDGGFRGLIRELRIYKRALTHAEIRTLSANAP